MASPKLQDSDHLCVDALKADMSIPSPLQIVVPKRRPGPLDINVTKRDASAPLPALAIARKIKRLQDVEYPEGVKGPREDLNKNAKDGKFRYDRGFLMQFMQVCKEKPHNLPPLDILGIEPMDRSLHIMTRGGSGRHRQPGIASGFGAKPGATPNPFALGQFPTPTSKLTNEERYLLSTGTCTPSVSSGPTTSQFGRSAGTASQGGPSSHSTGSNRIRSRRNEKRARAKGSGGSGFDPGDLSVLEAVSNSVSPLEIPASSQVDPTSMHKAGGTDINYLQVVDQQVSRLLDKFTMENFDSVSDQIIVLANRREDEKGGQTLIQIVGLVIERAIDEAPRSEIYARLCRKMMETISPEVQDSGIRNAGGKPIAGGQLFRKYLLNRCQEDFERSWVAKEAMAATATAKDSDDEVMKAANERKGDECELYSDQYYATQKAKYRGRGLIKFIGELFKLQMLTERNIHECVKKLLGNVENLEEDEIEGLCQLLRTAGQLLDVPKARAHMDVYFTRMKELCKSPKVSPRMQSMLQDVIELRDRKWVARGAVISSTTISAVHEVEKAAAEAQTWQRQLSMSGGGSRRGGERNVESGPDGWTMTGGSVVRPPPKAGDLSQFGKISKAATTVMGPGSVFTKGTEKGSLSRASPSPDIFSMPSKNPELAVDMTAQPRVDLIQGESREPPRRKKLLLPRTKHTPIKGTPPAVSEDGPEALIQVSETDAKNKIDEGVKEFFAIWSPEEADVYFTNLPKAHRFRLVDKLVAAALESKEADAVLVADFFARAASKGQCSPEVFEIGFMSMMELLDDIAIDAPNAFKFMAIMLKGAGFDRDKTRLARLACKSMDSDRLLRLVESS